MARVPARDKGWFDSRQSKNKPADIATSEKIGDSSETFVAKKSAFTFKEERDDLQPTADSQESKAKILC